jgi:hypothetical protein
VTVRPNATRLDGARRTRHRLLPQPGGF